MTRTFEWGVALALAAGCIPAVDTPAAAQARGSGQQRRSPGLFPGRGRPFFLTGTVVLEDGSPPPDPVPVVRSCGRATPVPLGFTDAEGHFSFSFGFGGDPTATMGAQNPFSADAFASGYHDMTGCELRAVAPGFSSDAIDLGGRRLLESPNVGKITLRRLEGVHGTVFSYTILHARKDARGAYEKARARAKEEKFDEAIDEYEKAVRAEPGFAAAWFELGLVHQIQGDLDDAKTAYRKAADADPDFVKPYRRLAALSFQEQDWPAVLETTEHLLWLDSVSYPDAYFYDAVARFYQNDAEGAERSAREAIRLDADRRIPKARYVLAAILIEKQDYTEAAELLREYVELAEPGPERDGAKSMLAQLEERLGPPPEKDPPD
jgi:tetratricopeptide (TPR) repeat protein